MRDQRERRALTNLMGSWARCRRMDHRSTKRIRPHCAFAYGSVSHEWRLKRETYQRRNEPVPGCSECDGRIGAPFIELSVRSKLSKTSHSEAAPKIEPAKQSRCERRERQDGYNETGLLCTLAGEPQHTSVISVFRLVVK